MCPDTASQVLSPPSAGCYHQSGFVLPSSYTFRCWPLYPPSTVVTPIGWLPFPSYVNHPSLFLPISATPRLNPPFPATPWINFQLSEYFYTLGGEEGVKLRTRKKGSTGHWKFSLCSGEYKLNFQCPVEPFCSCAEFFCKRTINYHGRVKRENAAKINFLPAPFLVPVFYFLYPILSRLDLPLPLWSFSSDNPRLCCCIE